jgi:hypothetical protein
MKANSRAIAGTGVVAPFQICAYSAFSCPVAFHLGNAPPFR